MLCAFVASNKLFRYSCAWFTLTCFFLRPILLHRQCIAYNATRLTHIVGITCILKSMIICTHLFALPSLFSDSQNSRISDSYLSQNILIISFSLSSYFYAVAVATILALHVYHKHNTLTNTHAHRFYQFPKTFHGE